jgi:hypothetical protein
MSDPIRVNGNLYSWGSITCKIDSIPVTGFTSIQFADKRERVFGWGMGRHHAPLGRSAGKYTPDPVKLTGWKHAVQELRERIAALSGTNSYGNAEFEIVTQATEPDQTPLIIVCTRCLWTGDSSTVEESADPLKDEIEVSTMGIRRNGLVLFDSSEGGAAL